MRMNVVRRSAFCQQVFSDSWELAVSNVSYTTLIWQLAHNGIWLLPYTSKCSICTHTNGNTFYVYTYIELSTVRCSLSLYIHPGLGAIQTGRV